MRNMMNRVNSGSTPTKEDASLPPGSPLREVRPSVDQEMPETPTKARMNGGEAETAAPLGGEPAAAASEPPASEPAVETSKAAEDAKTGTPTEKAEIEQVKAEVVKAEEVKSEEVTAEEVKAEGVNAPESNTVENRSLIHI